MPSLPPLSLYIHLPWCVRKCPYCDFNSHAAGAGLPESAYVAALLADLEWELSGLPDRTVETIFFGGGTPSLFAPESIAALLDGVRARIAVAPEAEITLEANPGTAESGRFRGFRQAGVTRLSIGIQSFHDPQLRALGRIHGRREALAAADMARAAGFADFNLDLMFGLPGQDLEQAQADVRTAIGLSPTHISFYQLTLEPNTLFHRHPPRLPDEDRTWAIQQAGQALLAEQGYARYEISAYARPDRQCRHNLNYWRFGDYLGLGAGAHGKLTDPAGGGVVRTWKIRHPQHYLEAAGSASAGGRAAVAVEQLPFEFLMNHLRLKEGFPLARFRERTGLPPEVLEPRLSRCMEDGLVERVDAMIRCMEDGLVERVDAMIRCTATGYDFLDEVLQRFLP